MSVLVDGVMAAVESGGADVEALLVGDFFGADEARGVTGAGGGDGGVKGMSEGVAERDAGRAGFDLLAGASAIKHARLGSHDGISLYTGGRGKEVESRRREKITQRRGETQSGAGKDSRGEEGSGTARSGCPTAGIRSIESPVESASKEDDGKAAASCRTPRIIFWRLRLWQRHRRTFW